jgi:EmrB/QacA subfamily drug resistance transporter
MSIDGGNQPAPTEQDGSRKYLTLTAMIFAVAMTFIDMTIVSIAVPEIQKDLSLSATGIQWVINGYLLSLAALFAFGGRLADIAGYRKMVLLGIFVFAFSSAMNGLTPESVAEPWLISFRILQGAGAAIMYPAALAIVVNAFPLRERGKAMAIFFAVAGGLTAVGPFAGGYLSQWTWRSIFWVNIPIAIIAVILTLKAKPSDARHPAPMDYKGLVLIVTGMGLSVLGLQQSSQWGWGNPATWGAIAAGFVLLVAFVLVERRTESPLIKVDIFRNRAFAVQNAVLFTVMIVFVPVFFFASMYSQLSLGYPASNAGLYLLVFFAGFGPGSQIGGRQLDRIGAKVPVVTGCAISAIGFYLWANKLTDLNLGDQWWAIVIAGAGMGIMLGPSNTDAINRAPRTSYGEATGITQTVRNYGSSLGMAVLGTLLININVSKVESTLEGAGLPKDQADQIAHAASHGGGGDSASFAQNGGAQAQHIFDQIQVDFAESSRVIFLIMSGVMAAAALIALFGLKMGRQQLDDGSDAGGVADPDSEPGKGHEGAVLQASHTH